MSFEVIFKILCEINTQTTGLRYDYIRFGDENARCPISGGGNSPASEVSKYLPGEKRRLGVKKISHDRNLTNLSPMSETYGELSLYPMLGIHLSFKK
jgi:hypothetical protein